MSQLVRRGIAVFAVLVPLGAGCGGSDTPISEQNCKQLAKTFREIQAKDQEINDGVGETDVEAARQNSNNAIALNNRVDELGGCPSEPDLQ